MRTRLRCVDSRRRQRDCASPPKRSAVLESCRRVDSGELPVFSNQLGRWWGLPRCAGWCRRGPLLPSTSRHPAAPTQARAVPQRSYHPPSRRQWTPSRSRCGPGLRLLPRSCDQPRCVDSCGRHQGRGRPQPTARGLDSAHGRRLVPGPAATSGAARPWTRPARVREWWLRGVSGFAKHPSATTRGPHMIAELWWCHSTHELPRSCGAARLPEPRRRPSAGVDDEVLRALTTPIARSGGTSR
jgi:hypothetical protein